MGLQYLYKQGKVQITHNRFLGYAKDADDDQEIITPFMTDRILDEFMPTK